MCGERESVLSLYRCTPLLLLIILILGYNHSTPFCVVVMDGYDDFPVAAGAENYVNLYWTTLGPDEPFMTTGVDVLRLQTLSFIPRAHAKLGGNLGVGGMGMCWDEMARVREVDIHI